MLIESINHILSLVCFIGIRKTVDYSPFYCRFIVFREKCDTMIILERFDILGKQQGKNSGLTLKEVVETEVSRDDEDNEVVNATPVTDPEQLANELSGSYSMTKGAFKEMKQLVLKSGTTFKSIGFSKL